MIKLEHLNKTFSANGKTFHAVNDVNLEINKGKSYLIKKPQSKKIQAVEN